ncbi:unnamed protein product [Clonostachys byssicola]|uniref:Uncharacterized protein n=1 Tax=Clonostachys byssicola TaxID=160290 RepID=A0A9N9UED7_9HYPO|nr:unnamed protein product [Clonostachys byssicola]
MWESIKSSLEAGGKARETQQEVLSSALTKIIAYEQEKDKKLDLLRSKIDLLVANAESTSAQLNTNQQLSSLQLDQALMTLTWNHEEPGSLFKQHYFFRKRRGATSTGLSTNEFWRSNQLSAWSSCQHSSIIAVKGTFTLKSAIQDFGIDVLQTLTRSGVTTLWALTSIDRPRSKSTMATTALLQYLVHQILQIKTAVQTEKSLSLHYMQYHSAKTSDEWFEFLVHLLSGLKGHIYLILDLAAAQCSSSSLDGEDFSLIQELCQLVQSYGSGPDTVKIKILLLAYEGEWDKPIRQDIPQSVVHVRKKAVKRVSGRANKRILPMLIKGKQERWI